MKIRVAEFQPMLVIVYPIIGFAGMMQVDAALKAAKLVTPVSSLGPLGMFFVSLVYTGLLTGFFQILDGKKDSFKVILTVMLSAICSAIFYFGVSYLVYLASGVNLDQGATQPWYALATLLVGVALSFVALFFVESTDFHLFSKPWVYFVQLAYMTVGMLVLVNMNLAPEALMALIKGGR